jgi:23S rRNA (guanosine2251-2'-O)-methyltransferase
MRPTHRARRPSARSGAARRGSPGTPADPLADAASWIYGRHAVRAALANPRRVWRSLVALAAQAEEAQALAAGAAATHHGTAPRMRLVDLARLAALLPQGAVHQGLALAVEPLSEPDLGQLLRRLPATSDLQVFVVLDRVADPQNVGAVLRAAAAFGAAAVVVARHGAAPPSGALAKAASGALDRVPLVRAANLAQALAALKRAGFWVCGLEAEAAQPLSALVLGERVALVLGAEGGGMRRLVRAACDHLARLPTSPAQPTLNVAAAAAVALYELVRGRDRHALE